MIKTISTFPNNKPASFGVFAYTDIASKNAHINTLNGTISTKTPSKAMGFTIALSNQNKYSFESKNIDLDYLNTSDFETKAKGLRGSIMIIGPLLSRFGKASIPKPGGDKIGRRKLDTHFEGLVKLGANFKYDNKNYRYNVTANKLKGSYILLDQPLLKK